MPNYLKVTSISIQLTHLIKLGFSEPNDDDGMTIKKPYGNEMKSHLASSMSTLVN